MPLIDLSLLKNLKQSDKANSRALFVLKRFKANLAAEP